ncbi:hypothetical protein MTER_00010 [Mycolicibacter terrae]|uniref:Uncharacterized protein n=2 Tax=Mycolicibacter terrae TaxID=1788 RepID=A0AAD1MFS2_9MYCO|nr:hypothetical protein MTER_00010 [Mycolicibacter terrae]
MVGGDGGAGGWLLGNGGDGGAGSAPRVSLRRWWRHSAGGNGGVAGFLFGNGGGAPVEP